MQHPVSVPYGLYVMNSDNTGPCHARDATDSSKLVSNQAEQSTARGGIKIERIMQFVLSVRTLVVYTAGEGKTYMEKINSRLNKKQNGL